MFVSNLSRRVSRNALWKAFESYGSVADVFILDHSKRPFCFAFVRYRSVEECRRAVRDGNGRWIDGRLILIKEASYGWKERRSIKDLKGQRKGPSSPKIKRWNVRDNITFKEALMTSVVKEGKKPCANLAYEDNAVVNEQSFKVAVSHVGGISVCITFEHQRFRDIFYDKFKSIDDLPIFEIMKWNGNHFQKLILVWVVVEDVPVHLWNVRFFKQLGNAWGEFIKTDECTAKKERLDHARMLIKVDNLLRVPSIATVVVKGEKCKISVALEDEIGLDNGDNTTATGDGLPESSYLAKPLGKSNSHELERICFDEVYCMGSDRNSSQTHSDYGNADLQVVGLEKLWALQVVNNHKMARRFFDSNHQDRFGENVEVAIEPFGRKNGRYKKVRKSIRQVIRVIGNTGGVFLGTSLSDDNIIHCNKVISSEPEVVSGISSSLGLAFDQDRDGLVAFFTNKGVGDLGR
ncbi:hypothetical protein PTKIN_Ptkin03bG0053800 [Pterospermum kingtungense]